MAKAVFRDSSIASRNRWSDSDQRKGVNQSRGGVFCCASCEFTAFAFADNNFWSSSEASATNAWNQNFNSGNPGNQNNNNKTNTNYVRAVRRLTRK